MRQQPFVITTNHLNVNWKKKHCEQKMKINEQSFEDNKFLHFFPWCVRKVCMCVCALKYVQMEKCVRFLVGLSLKMERNIMN